METIKISALYIITSILVATGISSCTADDDIAAFTA